jgi:tRNA-dihydrouridine synthase B
VGDRVPVTLKIRTGWDREHKNALRVARMAEDAGISMLTMHGRTRADLYTAKPSTTPSPPSSRRSASRWSPTATSPRRRRPTCARRTGADAIMIGRAAQGRPWMFREIEHFLKTGELLPPPKWPRSARS